MTHSHHHLHHHLHRHHHHHRRRHHHRRAVVARAGDYGAAVGRVREVTVGGARLVSREAAGRATFWLPTRAEGGRLNADGTDYVRAGVWFCALNRDLVRRYRLMHHAVYVLNRETGRGHAMLVRDTGTFSRRNIDLSVYASRRLNGGRADSFACDWWVYGRGRWHRLALMGGRR